MIIPLRSDNTPIFCGNKEAWQNLTKDKNIKDKTFLILNTLFVLYEGNKFVPCAKRIATHLNLTTQTVNKHLKLISSYSNVFFIIHDDKKATWRLNARYGFWSTLAELKAMGWDV